MVETKQKEVVHVCLEGEWKGEKQRQKEREQKKERKGERKKEEQRYESTSSLCLTDRYMVRFWRLRVHSLLHFVLPFLKDTTCF
jgi:hypothetical protein